MPIPSSFSERQARRNVLQQQVAELAAKEKELLEQVSHIRNALTTKIREDALLNNVDAPVSRLPDEMLSHIFMNASGWKSIEGMHPVLPISHVSRRWRSVALSIPTLWTTVVITDAQWPDLSLQKLLLKRSHSLQLEVSIVKLECSIQENAHVVAEKVGLFLASIYDRVCILEIEIEADADDYESEAFLAVLLSMFLPDLPALRRLDISLTLDDGQDTSHWDPVNRILHMNEPPSLLSSVSLRGISLRCCWPPLGCVTHLCLDAAFGTAALMPYSLFRQALTDLSSLRVLKLIGYLVDIPVSEPFIRAEIPTLRSLIIDRLERLTARYCAGLVETIYAPSLERFSIVNSFAPIADFYDLLPASSLKCLTFEYGTLTSNFMQSAAGVSCLSICKGVDLESLIKLLGPSAEASHQHPLWPNLRILTTVRIFEEELRSIVSARIVANAPLDVLRVDLGHDLELPSTFLQWCKGKVNVEVVVFSQTDHEH